MIDREVLAAALETVDAIGSSLFGFDVAFRAVSDAARERLAQLPEKCEHEQTKPHMTKDGQSYVFPKEGYWSEAGDYIGCSGKAYPAEMVDQLAGAMFVVPFHGEVHRDYVHRLVVAALDSINGIPE